MTDSKPICLYGSDGIAVGSVEGEWLFDERGEAMGFLFESGIFSVPHGRRLGTFCGSTVYNTQNRPIAHAAGARTNLLKPVASRLSPLVPRLKPKGVNVSGETISPDKLLPYKLCGELKELEASQ